jgi:hypothetical protein
MANYVETCQEFARKARKTYSKRLPKWWHQCNPGVSVSKTWSLRPSLLVPLNTPGVLGLNVSWNTGWHCLDILHNSRITNRFYLKDTGSGGDNSKWEQRSKEKSLRRDVKPLTKYSRLHIVWQMCWRPYVALPGYKVAVGDNRMLLDVILLGSKSTGKSWRRRFEFIPGHRASPQKCTSELTSLDLYKLSR